MKRYIKNSFELGEGIILRASIKVDVDLSDAIITAAYTGDEFPGVDEFRKCALAILQDEYKFDVKYDNYNGVRQQGWISNEDGSDSIYFNAIFDMHKAADMMQRVDSRLTPDILQGKVYCYIMLRVSQHKVNTRFKPGHINFFEANKQKHTKSIKDKLLDPVGTDEDVYIDEVTLYRKFQEGLDQLRDRIEGNIYSWAQYAKRHYLSNNNSGDTQ